MLLLTFAVVENPNTNLILVYINFIKFPVFGYTKSYYSDKPCCVKCGEEHLMDKYSKDSSTNPVKYLLCTTDIIFIIL